MKLNGAEGAGVRLVKYGNAKSPCEADGGGSKMPRTVARPREVREFD